MLKNIFTKAFALFLAFGLVLGVLCVPFAAVVWGSSETGIAYAADESNIDPDTGKPRDKDKPSEADKDHYMNFDGLTSKLDPSTPDEGNLVTVVIPKIRELITTIALPVAILLVCWRIVYLAIFPTLAQVDPLDMLSNSRYAGAVGSGGRGGTRGGKGAYDAARKALKQEVKGTVIGLVVVAIVWILIQLGLWAATVILAAV